MEDVAPVIGLDLSQRLRQPAAGVLRVWHSDFDLWPPPEEAFLTDAARGENQDLLGMGGTAHTHGSRHRLPELLCLADAAGFVTQSCRSVETVSPDAGQQSAFPGVHGRSTTVLVLGKPG